MLYSAILTIFNLVVAGILSKNDNFFKNKEDQLTGDFNKYFKRELKETEQKFLLRVKNKYQLEFFLFIFVIIGFLIINSVLSYFVVKFVSGNENDLVENLFKSLFVEFIIIIATALIINKFKETILNYKKIQSGNFYYSIITNTEIHFPFVTLEGSVSTELSKTNNTFLAIPINEISEFIVEPSRRVASFRGYAYTPPYYKVFLKDKTIPIYIMRMYFKGQEKIFLEGFAQKLKVNITYNDQLD